MSRPKEFDTDSVLDAAIEVFRENGYAGSSAQMLTEAMQIGRQSLYNAFGGKWQLYCLALERYVKTETEQHIACLQSHSDALEGVEALLDRVISEAQRACLGVSSVCEFSSTKEEITKIREHAGSRLHDAVKHNIINARTKGQLSGALNPDHGAAFIVASVATIRLAARGGASAEVLNALKGFTLQALK
jgi:AcrR family transcriptional regulator